MNIADQSPPHIPTPELFSRQATDLVTPVMCAQASVHEFSEVWEYDRLCEFGGLRRAETLGQVVDERSGTNETASM